jgi:hypothetical protein
LLYLIRLLVSTRSRNERVLQLGCLLCAGLVVKKGKEVDCLPKHRFDGFRIRCRQVTVEGDCFYDGRYGFSAFPLSAYEMPRMFKQTASASWYRAGSASAKGLNSSIASTRPSTAAWT